MKFFSQLVVFLIAAGALSADQISHARFEKVQDAAHAVFVDQPQQFEELLKSFVTGLPTNTALN